MYKTQKIQGITHYGLMQQSHHRMAFLVDIKTCRQNSRLDSPLEFLALWGYFDF